MYNSATAIYPVSGRCRKWLEQALFHLDQGKGLGFRDRCGDIIVITPSAKQPGNWQATWFHRGGPYRDQLDSDPRQLLLALSPMLREWLIGDALERAVNARVRCRS